ncbi:Spo0B domain-containing protein [Gorillibacterium massiliense]|uniref:Spo0B domain-containing protein n=1 Tax=Gorillibacterium massiliense TaxID=1280390 RepID=UPI000694AA6A|nr:Spo0B domain-containing protein [Gorillibacterium massiliense]
MKRWKLWGSVSWGLVLLILGLSVMIGWSALVVRIIALFPVACGATLIWHGLKRRHEDLEKARMIRMLSVYRHDWMNDIQVLLGYAKLQKYDKLLDFMDKINAKAYQESCVAKLGDPDLIAFYYRFRMEEHSFNLEFEFDQEIHLSKLPLHGNRVTRLIRETVTSFNVCSISSSGGEANQLSLAFEEEQDALLLDFVYEGEYHPGIREKLEALIAAYSAEQVTLELEAADAGISANLRVPFFKQGADSA